MCEQCMAETVTIATRPHPRVAIVVARKDGWMMKTGDIGLVQMNDPDIWFAPFSEVVDAGQFWNRKHKRFRRMLLKDGWFGRKVSPSELPKDPGQLAEWLACSVEEWYVTQPPFTQVHQP